MGDCFPKLVLAACAALSAAAVCERGICGDPLTPHRHESPPIGNTRHLAGSPTIWLGRHVAELVAAKGEPDMILEATVGGYVLFGDVYGVIYVYWPNSNPGGECYHAFVVEHDSARILAYHCR